jgi:hypothetical protein
MNATIDKRGDSISVNTFFVTKRLTIAVMKMSRSINNKLVCTEDIPKMIDTTYIRKGITKKYEWDVEKSSLPSTL